MSYSEALELQVSLLNKARSNDGTFLKVAAIAEREGMAEPGAPQKAARGLAVSVRALEAADAYFWAPARVCDIEAAALGVPECTLTPDLLPSVAGLWLFAQPLEAELAYSERATVLTGLVWLAEDLEDGAPGIHVGPILHQVESGRRTLGPLMPWHFGRSAEEVTAKASGRFFTRTYQGGVETLSITDGYRAMTAFFTAGVLFLKQRLMATESTLAERASRRRLERDGWPRAPLIRVVQLCRRESQSQQRGSSEPVNWSHRWFVQGHWRQQACGPKRAERRPRWIGPFVKGPGDKPLKPPRSTIFAVVR